MLYWLGAYAIVAAAVLLPFLLLYLAVAVFWWCMAIIRFVMHTVSARSHWYMAPHKPA
jgi:hypothetical protein